jgi:hypothetical protein
MARLFTLHIEGEAHDVDDFELDEMIEVQNMCGGTAFLDLNLNDANVWKALAFVIRKRSHPEVTLEEIGKLKGLELVGGEEEMPPLPPSEGAASQNGSETPDSSGARPSPASTPGSPLSASGS